MSKGSSQPRHAARRFNVIYTTTRGSYQSTQGWKLQLIRLHDKVMHETTRQGQQRLLDSYTGRNVTRERNTVTRSPTGPSPSVMMEPETTALANYVLCQRMETSE